MRPALVPILFRRSLYAQMLAALPADGKDPWAAWDFINGGAIYAGSFRGALANTPNWTFTRASTAYYRNASGVLVPFASGALRTGDRGALIEGAGTNLCLQSQTFDNASLSKTRASVSANAAVAPDGTTTADKLVEDTTATNTHTASQGITVSNSTVYTFSVYAKAAERTWLGIFLNGTTASGSYSHFNLSSGALGTIATNATATITALANGWYRCTVTATTNSTSMNCFCAPATGDNGTSYNGAGVSGIYLWGAQLEATASASSYIPTTTASATRAADSLTVTGVSGLDYPLTLYAEFERGVDNGASNRVVYLCATNFNNRATLDVDGSDRAAASMDAGGVGQASLNVTGALATGSTYKMAARFSTDSVQLARGGTLATEDTSATTPTSPNLIVFGNNEGGSGSFYGYLRRLAIYASAKTDVQLQSMTT